MLMHTFQRTSEQPIRRWSALLFVLPLSFLGCGGTGVGGGASATEVEPPKVSVGPVTGKVYFGREVPVGARVALFPLSRKEGEGGAPATGVVESDGRFEISSYGKGDGAAPGQYAVVVEWFKKISTKDGESAGGPNVLPREYANPKQTPFKITVKEGTNDVGAHVIKQRR